MSNAVDRPETAQPPPRRLAAVLDTAAAEAAPRRRGDPAVAAARIAVLAALFAALHHEQLRQLWQAWTEDPNWGHGLLIPLFSLYLLYTRRHDIAAAPRRTFHPGLAIMVLSLAVELAAVVVVRNYWLWGLGMVGMLFGLVLYLGGPGLIRVAWLPVLFLSLSVPLPNSLYSRIAYPLQELSAAGAVAALHLFGVDVLRTASNLSFISRSFVPRNLTVVEACAGMRLLMAFFALGVAIAYLEQRPVWQRVILVAAGIPIAVFCNVLRVAITCSMHYFDRPEWGEGFLHAFTGMLMLIPAFGMLYGLGWIFQRLFEEDDGSPSDGSPVGREEGNAV